MMIDKIWKKKMLKDANGPYGILCLADYFLDCIV